MKHTIALLSAILMITTAARANDGVYFTSGNFLVPVHETDISAAKETLTITIGHDGYASVDVYYEFMNSRNAKTVKMAFEATPQYNDSAPLNRNGIHPYIKDFTVNMNGTALPHSNSLVAFWGNGDARSREFTALDPGKWKAYGEVPDSILPAGDALYNAALDSIAPYAYAYWFEAPFKPGLNIVHHTYRYRMSYNVAEKFNIPYWLTPVTRWANGQADDFTLFIKADDTTEFCLCDSLFSAAPFASARGREIYRLTSDYGENFIFTTLLPDDTIRWHSRNFRPTADMCITSPAWSQGTVASNSLTQAKVVIDAEGHTSRYLARCGDSYFVEVQDYGLVKQLGSRIEEYSARNGQGFITINSNAAKRVNVRRRPTTASAAICTLSSRDGELPDVLPCLGLTMEADGYMWYKTKVNGTTGYIRQDLMVWDAINTY